MPSRKGLGERICLFFLEPELRPFLAELLGEPSGDAPFSLFFFVAESYNATFTGELDFNYYFSAVRFPYMYCYLISCMTEVIEKFTGVLPSCLFKRSLGPSLDN